MISAPSRCRTCSRRGRRSSGGSRRRRRAISSSPCTTPRRCAGAAVSRAPSRFSPRSAPPSTPVVVARAVGREEQSVAITCLGDLDQSSIDMMTVLIVGSTETRSTDRHVHTPRGYRRETRPGGGHGPEGGQVAMPLVAGSMGARSTGRHGDAPRSDRAKRNRGGGHMPEGGQVAMPPVDFAERRSTGGCRRPRRGRPAIGGSEGRA